MKPPSETHVVIAGAGLVGALLACQLGKRGYRVTLCERRPDPRAAGYIGGRSINLALSCRGITALKRVGLDETVLASSIRMPGRMLHDEKSNLTFQAYSSNPEDAIRSISRSDLNLILLDAADKNTNVEIRFESRCISADLDAPSIELETPSGRETIAGDFVIGCDGAFSAVRGAMQVTDRFNYQQSYLDHGYKELVIPPAAECGVDASLHDGFAMDPHALHIWPRGHYMMIALPNDDRTFTCTLFWPYEGPNSFAELAPDGPVRAYFDKHFPDASRLMPSLETDYANNPIGSLVTIRCSPWQRHTRTLLLGDAAHAIVPFYGQGMNAGFEDCRLFDEAVEHAEGDLSLAIERFAEARIPAANAIADLALENFVEMRDSVADPLFLLRKRVEHTLHRLDAERFMPLYNLVSFSNMPYDEARVVGGRVVRLAQRIAGSLQQDGETGLDDDALHSRVVELLEHMEGST